MSCAFNAGPPPAATTPGTSPVDSSTNAAPLANAAANGAASASADPAQAPMVQVLQLLFSLVQLLSAQNGGNETGSAATQDSGNCGGCPAGGAQNPQAMTDLSNIMNALAADLDQAASRR